MGFLFRDEATVLMLGFTAAPSGHVTIGAAILAGACLFLWLTEKVPVWVPTLLLWIGIPLFFGGVSEAFRPRQVLTSAADPILLLFLSGFTFGVAAHKQGADRIIANAILRLSGDSTIKLIGFAAVTTAVLSMWISNIAAAALMFAAFAPLWKREPPESNTRRALLLTIALAANVAGVATPISAGANGIAMAEVNRQYPINFGHWMAFGIPLAAGLLVVVLLLVSTRLRLHGPPTPRKEPSPENSPLSRRRIGMLGVILATVIGLWLTEPLHGIPTWMVALGAIATLLISRLIHVKDVRNIDWATLLLIAGGITLGDFLTQSGLITELATRLPLSESPPAIRLLILCLTGALFAAFMSNTATAGFLIPLAISVDAAPSTAILVAVSTSLGMAFVISTPANAMAVGHGLRSREFLVPGLVLMVGGSLLVAFTGRMVLNAVGIP